MQRRSARLHMKAVARQQALVDQIAKGAGERYRSGERARVRKHPIRQRRERQRDRVFAKDEGQHYALHP